MSAKRYTAGDMRRALQMVREDLGADAVILSSNRTESGFEVVACGDGEWRKVNGDAPARTPLSREIQSREFQPREELSAVAAQDERVTFSSREAADRTQQIGEQTQQMEARLSQHLSANLSAHKEESEQWAQDVRAQLHGELRDMREWLEWQWRQGSAGGLVDTHLDQLRQRLERLGIPAGLHAGLLRGLPAGGDERANWRVLMSQLQSRLRVLPESDKNLYGCVALVGPSGAGKTTTLQKLAVRHALRYGNSQVAVISLDAERIGAHQALGVFCKMLDVPLRIAHDRDSLDLALRALRSRSLVLIDIPGHHIASDSQRRLCALLQSIPEWRCYLTLPCTMQFPVMQAWWQGCRVLAPQALILTKLDEAALLGEAIGMALASELPLAWITDGPNVPSDLHDADTHRLLARAVELARMSESAIKNTAEGRQRLSA